MKAVRVQRARPLLGTFVEIAVWGCEAQSLHRAVDRAFRSVERLQALLSVYDPASELSRLNRHAVSTPVRVGIDTWRVLRAATRIAFESDGAFDPAAGARNAGIRDIRFLPGRRVRFARPLRIDLGGIAKGYCVDRAVTVLRRGGAEAGIVNAGGDLRAFGPRSFQVHLRHPADSSRVLPWRRVRNTAVATSARYSTGEHRCAGALLDGRSGEPIAAGTSVTVVAPRAWLADALTKVVASQGGEAAAMLARYGANAWILSAAVPEPACPSTVSR